MRSSAVLSLFGLAILLSIPVLGQVDLSRGLLVSLMAFSSQQTLLGKIDNTNGVGAQSQMGIDFSSYPGALFGVYPVTNGCATPPSNGACANTGSSFGTSIHGSRFGFLLAAC